jgi:hypothetical protein
MKKITMTNRKYGPFHEVQVLEDRYLCDGCYLPFSVIGQGEIADVVDGEFPTPTIVEATTEPTKEELLAELQALTEKIQALA